MAKEFKITSIRLAELEEELQYLKTTREKEVAEHLKEARSFGDLSENSEYDEAKNEQAQLYGRIAEVENILAHAVIIDDGLEGVEASSVGYIGLDGTGVGDMTKASYDPQGTVLAAGGIPGFVTNALPSYGSSTPEMDGTGTPGISTNVARADHVHPSDTGKADKVHASTHATAGSDPIDPDDIGAAKLDSNGKVLASEASAHIVFKSGSATLALDEAGASIFMTNSSAATITIPANSSVAFPMGTEIEIVQTDAAITFAGASGVTINSPEGALTLNSQHKSACLKKYGTDTWNLQGDLV